jgi:very-short-patch-repair endonuclease
MILVRSVTESDLNANDLKAKVLRHFREPMPKAVNSSATLIERCQSGFERDLFVVLSERGYRVIPQVGSEGFSIDMVVEGESGRRLAIECDGDQYHGPERWADDMRRQRILERVGWNFWRCFGSNYSLDRGGVLEDLFHTLERMGIKPGGGLHAGSQYTEHHARRSKVEGYSEGRPGDAESSPSEVSSETTIPNSDTETRLRAGDRIVIRYLDDQKSRSEFYLLTERVSDPLNGVLSLSSPLALALIESSPGDEITARIGDRDRLILFVTLEREPRQAA